MKNKKIVAIIIAFMAIFTSATMVFADEVMPESIEVISGGDRDTMREYMLFEFNKTDLNLINFELDGTIITDTTKYYYTSDRGMFSLYESAVADLAAGVHTLVFNFEEGTATTTFNIIEADPEKGESIYVYSSYVMITYEEDSSMEIIDRDVDYIVATNDSEKIEEKNQEHQKFIDDTIEAELGENDELVFTSSDVYEGWRPNTINYDKYASIVKKGQEDRYKILSGADQEVTAGDDINYVLDDNEGYLIYVKVDGEVVVDDEQGWVIENDTLPVTLKDLTLTPGIHKVRFVFMNGITDTTLSVKAAQQEILPGDEEENPGEEVLPEVKPEEKPTTEEEAVVVIETVEFEDVQTGDYALTFVAIFVVSVIGMAIASRKVFSNK